MAYATANGAAVIEGRISVPRTGAWTAELLVDSQTSISGSVTLSVGGLKFKGTTRRGGAFLGTSFVGLVGGAGGLSGTSTPKTYRAAPLSMPLADIAAGAGETLASTLDNAVTSFQLPFWVMAQSSWGAALERLLDNVAGAVWRILPNGSLWVGVETWPKVQLAAQVLAQHPLSRRLEAEILPQLVPGVSWYGGQVGYVEHTIRADKLRTTVWFEGAA